MKFLVVALSLFAFNSFAGYVVTGINQSEKDVTISYSTQERFENVCILQVESATISSPKYAFTEGISNEEIGVILLSVSADKETRCFRAPGIHSGKAKLPVGEQIPYLKPGMTYLVKINGQFVKKFTVQ